MNETDGRDPATATPAGALAHAPGHRFDPARGSGIQWSAAQMRLWWRHTRGATAPTPPGGPSAFWYDLRFATVFPQVAAWWFGAPWTQQVRLWPAETTLGAAEAGWMQFVDAQSARLPWTWEPGRPPRIHTPLPEGAAHGDNLALRWVLESLVTRVRAGQIAPGEWRVVTSLVERSDLAAAFPTAPGAWCAAADPRPLRARLAAAQGPEPAP